MKKYKTLFLIGLIMGVLISCSSDDEFEDNKPLTIIVSHGCIENKGIGQPDQGCDFCIALVSDGINLENNTGVGDVISIDLMSESTDSIKDGTYTVGIDEEFPPGTFAGLCFVGLNIQSQEFSAYYGIKSGTAIISKSGDTYEITISVLGDQRDDMLGNLIKADVPISCHYLGLLTEHEFN